MQSTIVNIRKLAEEQRFTFEDPEESIKQYPDRILRKMGDVISFVKDKTDPTKKPESAFQYVDIGSIDLVIGSITEAEELIGDDAPSRARKLIRQDDIIISTTRPTRGAIAIIPSELDGEVCSTGFSVVRGIDIDLNYLHFALRTRAILEQFGRRSTGSSYPAILEREIARVRIPVPDPSMQDIVAKTMKQVNSIYSDKIQTVEKFLAELDDNILDMIGLRLDNYSLKKTFFLKARKMISSGRFDVLPHSNDFDVSTYPDIEWKPLDHYVDLPKGIVTVNASESEINYIGVPNVDPTFAEVLAPLRV